MSLCLDEQKCFLLLAWYVMRKKKATRRWWVSPTLQKRKKKGAYRNFIVEMRLNDHNSFYNYLRMMPDQFDHLLSIVGPAIQKRTTFFRKPVSAKERLAVTLRYLASGDSMSSISYAFRIGKPTISNIIASTCTALWETLRPLVLKPPDSKMWLDIAEEFQNLWRFPNCVGALDGKHVVVQATNFTGTFNIVLMAVADAHYKFVMVDVAPSSQEGDLGIFHRCKFGRSLEEGQLKLPAPSPLPHSSGYCIPYVFVADESFALRENVMRPYPGRTASPDEIAFNDRLSRAKKCIENAFGVLASRFQIFSKPIIAKLETSENVTRAAACLHNFLKISEESLPPRSRRYCPPGFADFEDSDGVMQDGQWRVNGLGAAFQRVGRTGSNNRGSSPTAIRDYFKEYFRDENQLTLQIPHVTTTGQCS